MNTSSRGGTRNTAASPRSAGPKGGRSKSSGGGGKGAGRRREAASKRWGLIAFVSGIAGALVLWRMPSSDPEFSTQQPSNPVTVGNEAQPSPVEPPAEASVLVPSGTRLLGGLRAGLRDEAPASFDSNTHAFFVPGTVPGSEESVGVPAAWPADESLTLLYASPLVACRGTTAGAWRLADETDARDLGSRYVTLVARRGDCPLEGAPALALRGVVPADVVFLPADSKGLDPGSAAFAKALPNGAVITAVDFAFRVGDTAWAAVTARSPGDSFARFALVSIATRDLAPVPPLSQGSSPRR